MARSRFWSLWAYSAFICVCKAEEAIERELTRCGLCCVMATELTLPPSASLCPFETFEALERQTAARAGRESASPQQKIKPSWFNFADCQRCGPPRLPLAGRLACVQREPKINSEEGETTPGVGRPLLLGPSHAGGLLLSHSNAPNRKLVWAIWNAWEGERRRGGGGGGGGV